MAMLSVRKRSFVASHSRRDFPSRRSLRRFVPSLIGGSLLVLAFLLVLGALPGYTAIPVQASTWSRSTFTMFGTKPATTAVEQTAPVAPPIMTPTGQTINASGALVRLNQLDGNQYNSQADAT